MEGFKKMAEKKTIKVISVFLAVVMCLSVLPFSSFADESETGTALTSEGVEVSYKSFTDDDFLHTEGMSLYTKDGRKVTLRGTNFGGWGLMESWMTPLNESEGEDVMLDKLVSRFGVEKTHELMKTYRSNWITEVDFANVKALGMNVIRLPIWYRNFQSDENGTWFRDENGNIDFSQLDWVVNMCHKYGIYLIIDLHGAPGYQNEYDHSGRKHSCTFWDDTDEAKKNQKVVEEFWKVLAAHYKGEPAVAMYDLLNESLGTDKGVLNKHDEFNAYMNTLYQDVRAVDPDHIITMEAVWTTRHVCGPDKYGWTNVVYQPHFYDKTNFAFRNNMNICLNSNYNCPLYIGEFFPFNNATFDYVLSLYNLEDASWTTWSYKGTGGGAKTSDWWIYGSDEIKNVDPDNDSYEKLMEKIGSCLRTDSGKWAKTPFADHVAKYTDGYYSVSELAAVPGGTSQATLKMFRALFIDLFNRIRNFLKNFFTFKKS